MRLLSVTMRDFGSYGEATLDLSDKESVILTGRNGAGKSTVIGAVTWALWGQFEGDLDEVVRLGHEKAEVEVRLRARGDEYRVTRTRSVAGRGKSTLSVFVLRDGAWTCLDGANMDDTQAIIEAALGLSYKMAASTCLSLQGDAGRFSRAKPAERRAILARLLGLERYEGYREKARRKARDVSLLADKAQETIAGLEAKGSDDAVQAATLAVDVAEDTQRGARQAAQDADAARSQAADDVATLMADVATADAAEKAVRDAAADVTTVRQRGQRAADDLTAWNAKCADALAALNGLPSYMAAQEVREAADGDAQAAQQAQAAEAEAQAALVAAKQAAADAQREADAWTKAQKDESLRALREAEVALAGLMTEAKQADVDRGRAHDAADRLGSVPCGGEGVYAACPLIAAAVKGRDSLVPLEDAVLAARAKADGAAAEVERRRAAAQQEPQVPGDLRAAVWNTAKAMPAAVDAAREAGDKRRMVEERARRSRTDADAIQARYRQREALDAVVAANERDRAGLQATLDECNRALAAATDPHEKAVTAAATAGNATVKRGSLEQAQAAYRDRERQAREAADALFRATGALSAQQVIYQTATEVAARLKAEVAALVALRTRHADLLALVQAYHDVPHLIVESLVPQIEAKANDLLARISTSGLRVALVTRDALKSSDKIVDTLRIDVLDTVGQRSYERYSGGEKFRIDWALRVALSAVLSARAGVPLETLVVDEGFGSLDDEGIAAFANDLARTAALFGVCIVISHVPTLADAMPNRVHVQKGSGGSMFVVG